MKYHINYRSKENLCHSMQTTQVLTKKTKTKKNTMKTETKFQKQHYQDNTNNIETKRTTSQREIQNQSLKKIVNLMQNIDNRTR